MNMIMLVGRAHVSRQTSHVSRVTSVTSGKQSKCYRIFYKMDMKWLPPAETPAAGLPLAGSSFIEESRSA